MKKVPLPPLCSRTLKTLLPLLFLTVSLQAAEYSQNFDGFENGETDLGDGSVIASNDGTNTVQDNALRLTQAGVNSTAASFILPPLDASEGWSATFDFIIEHSGANTPADGFSFNFGEIPEDENFGDPAEEGYGAATNHISFQVDTWKWDDENQDAGLGIEVSGEEAAFVPAINDEANFKPNERVIGTVVASWDPANGASFQTVGLTTDADFENIPTSGFVAEATHGFSFLARTGGHNETLIIDNLQIGELGAFTPQTRDPKIGGDTELVIQTGFGTRATGQINVTNSGAANDLVIESATLTGANTEAFTIDVTFPVTVPPGGSVALDVEFTAPLEPGNQRATLTLLNNDSAEIARNRVIEITGTPIATDGTYTQTFDGFGDGTTDLNDGSLIESNDGTNSIQNGALRMTQAETNSTGASFVLPPFDASAGWSATFDFTIEHTGANTPADGFSFNFGEIPEGQNFGNPAEEGYGEGIPH
ncbi:MAG: hypothetical protein AAF514_08510, partial [Verrucomicrobiota bacterium]